MQDPMQWSEALLIGSTGVVLPSADVITDWMFVVKLLTHTIAMNSGCEKGGRAWTNTSNDDLTSYGYICMVCPTLSILFSFLHWHRMEKGWRRRLMTLPLIPFYTPFKAAGVIYWGLKNKNNWQDKKTKLNQELITVEPLVESAPQAMIMNVIWIITQNCIGPSFGSGDPLDLSFGW